jgi:protein phosphatase
VTRFRVGAISDTGRVRSNNEDSKLVSEGLYAVADGMGGHKGGEVASALAVETLSSTVASPTRDALIEAVHVANRAVFERAAESAELRGMGTTLCAIALVDSELDPDTQEIAWVNVGDSRIYLFRDGDLIQLSTDHSLVEDLRRDGQLTDEEAAIHPQRNIVTRALGIDADVSVDSSTVVPYTGDRFLLCSDGLFDEITADQITATLRRLADPADAASELVRQANEHGGRDNVTCVVVDIVDDDDRAATASAALAADPQAAAFAPRTADRRGDLAADDPDATRPQARVAPSGDDDLPFGRQTDDLYSDLDRAKSRHVTWRVVAFVIALVAVAGVAVVAINYYATRTYYVDFSAEEVTIYQGQPGGVLFVDPSVSERTGLRRRELTEVERQAVAKRPSFGNLDDARSFTHNLEVRVEDRKAPPSTTTTAPTTTTTSAPGGQATTVPTSTTPTTARSTTATTVPSTTATTPP